VGVSSDEVKQAPALVADGSMNNRSERGVIFEPHVLQHPDRRQDIEFPGCIAIIVFDELHATGKSLSERPFAAHGQSAHGKCSKPLPGHRNSAPYGAPELPTAAGFDSRFSWLEP
jgi:hypothetical protein